MNKYDDKWSKKPYWFIGYCILCNGFFNTFRPNSNVRHFPDGIFNCIFLNEINFDLNFVPKGLFNTIPSLVQIMALRRSGDKPLSEPVLVILQTYVCVTRPQWFNVCRTCAKSALKAYWKYTYPCCITTSSVEESTGKQWVSLTYADKVGQ